MEGSPEYHHRVMSHTPQPHGTPQFHRHVHDRNPSEDSIGSGPRRSSMQHTPQLLPHRTPPLHPRQNSLHHIDTPPQQFQVPMIPGHSSPQPATSAVRGGIMQQQQHMHHSVGQEGMGLGIGMSTPQPYGIQYNPYGQQQHVYLSAQVILFQIYLTIRTRLEDRPPIRRTNIPIHKRIPINRPHPCVPCRIRLVLHLNPNYNILLTYTLNPM